MPTASQTRADILDLVRIADTGLTTADVARKFGLRLSTARSHLDRLVADGSLVKARASGGAPRRPAWRYRANDPEPRPSTYRVLLGPLVEQLAEDDAEQARDNAHRVGRHWGRMLAATGGGGTGPVEAATAVLDALGFAPRRASPGLHLRRCPYLELVRTHPDTMCRMHAGIIQGVLDRTGGGSPVLEPFAAPGACVVRLRRPPTQRR